jgi:hypothetical protein
LGDELDVNHAAANGFGDGGPEQEGGDEVEEGSPEYGKFRRENASGDYGGDAVGSVVKSVEKVEGQGDQDCDDEEEEIGFHESLPVGMSARL